MSYKDEWNERHYNRMEELREQGIPERVAFDLAAKHADGLWEDLADAADYLRKRQKEGE